MSDDLALIVTDTSPLITLAKADALALLLKLGMTVRIPDIVYLEATRDGHEDGGRIIDWAKANREQVEIAPTSQIIEWQVLKENGLKPRDYGERAAVEVVTEHTQNNPGAGVLLLYEDGDMNRLAVRAEVTMATTGSFLAALEEAQVIQSADQILDQAAEAGRNVLRQRAQASNERIAEAARSAQERRRDRGRGFDR